MKERIEWLDHDCDVRSSTEPLLYNPQTGEQELTLGWLAKRIELDRYTPLKGDGIVKRSYYAIRRAVIHFGSEAYYHAKREERINARLNS